MLRLNRPLTIQDSHGKRRKAAVILWPEVLSFTGAVSRSINEFAEAVAETS
jgi:hypothetical protein